MSLDVNELQLKIFWPSDNLATFLDSSAEESEVLRMVLCRW